MKVLHVIPGLSGAQGGLQAALLNLCRAQVAAGITPVICALAEPQPPDAVFAAFETHLFECTFRATGASREMKSWLAAHSREFDAVIAHSLWRDPLLYAADADAPLIVVAHGMLDPEALRHHAWRKLWRLRARLPGVLKHATVVYTCEGEKNRALEGAGRMAKRSAVIPLAVPVPDVPPQASPTGPIVALGRIHPRKGLLEWVQALSLLAREHAFSAVHAGPVEDHRYARRVYAAAKPLVDAGRLEFKGALAYADAQALLATASIVTAPCAVHENFGMVIVEALAQARPVAAGRKGLLVSELEAAGAVRGAELDAPAFAGAMAGLLTDPAAAAEMAAAGYRWAAEHVSLPVVGARWRELSLVD